MKREDVEALRKSVRKVRRAGMRHALVDADQLSALLDIAEAVQDAPVYEVGSAEAMMNAKRVDIGMLPLPAEMIGQQVRLVRVGGGA